MAMTRRDLRKTTVANFVETLGNLSHVIVGTTDLDEVAIETEVIGNMLRDECQAGNMRGLLMLGKVILDHANRGK